MQRLFTDLAGPMLTSPGGARYCLTIVHVATNMGPPVLRMDKSAAAATLGFRTFLSAVNANGKPGCLRTENTPQVTRTEFHRLKTENHIPSEFTAVNGPKRNRRVERKLGFVAE